MPTGHGDGPAIWRLEDRSRRRQPSSSLRRSGLRARRRVSPAPHSVQARGETPSPIAVNTSPKEAVRITPLIVCFTLTFGNLSFMEQGRSALRCGIGEGRCSYHVAGIRSFITGDETFTDTGVHGAVGGA